MVRIYTDRKAFNAGEIILDNDAFFGANIVLDELRGQSERIMDEIDRARVLDFDTGAIKTPYGVTDIFSLSTGCKTVLNYLHLVRHRNKYPDMKAILGTECGQNALEALFRSIEILKVDLIVVVEHRNNIEDCSERDYYINDRKEAVKSLYFID